MPQIEKIKVSKVVKLCYPVFARISKIIIFNDKFLDFVVAFLT